MRLTGFSTQKHGINTRESSCWWCSGGRCVSSLSGDYIKVVKQTAKAKGSFFPFQESVETCHSTKNPCRAHAGPFSFSFLSCFHTGTKRRHSKTAHRITLSRFKGVGRGEGGGRGTRVRQMRRAKMVFPCRKKNKKGNAFLFPFS
jgi:hypothetical protein